MKEIFTLEKHYDLEEYHKVKSALSNTLKTMKLSLLENLEMDPNDSGMIIPQCFKIVDCNLYVDLDVRALHLSFQFECLDLSIINLLVTNADRMCIGFYINEGFPSFEVLWNRYGEHVKLQNFEQDGEDNEYK